VQDKKTHLDPPHGILITLFCRDLVDDERRSEKGKIFWKMERGRKM